MRCGPTSGRVPRARGEEGFTLLEAVVALLVLGVALVPLVNSLTEGLRAEKSLGAHLEAVSLAESRMNELALLPVDSVAGYLRPREGLFPSPYAGYRWRALMRPLPESPALVQAAVLVRWDGGEYSLETTFHRPEMLPDHAPAVQ